MKERYFLPVFALLCAGFASPVTSEPVTPSGPASFVAPKDKALVVFVSNSKRGKAYIVDEDKKFVTMLQGNQYGMTTVKRGKHTFYVISENAELVRGELGAGRTYIIEIRAKMGLGKSRVIVEPVLRNTRRFAESAEWLRETGPSSPDPEDGAKWIRRRQDVVNKKIAVAEEEWSQRTEKYRASLSISVEDGRTADEASKL